MASSRENDNSFKEFCLYGRHFSQRMIHAVVQARMGESISTRCIVPSSQRAFFSLEIDEIGETSAYLKTHVKEYPPKIKSLNIDFILYFPSGEVLPLETWSILMGKKQEDYGFVASQIYMSFSQLLRSVVAAARVTPAYRYYVKDQSADNFVIMYRVYPGESNLSLLGPDCKSMVLGEIGTPYGSFSVHLNYRTNMEMIPMSYDNIYTESFVNKPTSEGNTLRRQSTMPAISIRYGSATKLSPASPGPATFSTSPGSQEFPFGSQESQGKLGGRSASSSVSSTTSARTALKSSKSSPQASSSFPQRNSRRARLRNNSFPFASLLYDSQYLDDERLPKVDEDADLGNTSLRQRSSPAGGNGKLRTSPSAPGSMDEVTDNMSIKESKSSASLAESKRSIEHVIEEKDETPEAETEVESPDKTDTEEPKKKEEVESGDEMESSDDSYVKVFSFGASEDLGEDLTEFVREVRSAPVDLSSFAAAQTSALNEQLNIFKERAAGFDTFIARLKDDDEYS